MNKKSYNTNNSFFANARIIELIRSFLQGCAVGVVRSRRLFVESESDS